VILLNSCTQLDVCTGAMLEEGSLLALCCNILGWPVNQPRFSPEDLGGDLRIRLQQAIIGVRVEIKRGRDDRVVRPSHPIESIVYKSAADLKSTMRNGSMKLSSSALLTSRTDTWFRQYYCKSILFSPPQSSVEVSWFCVRSSTCSYAFSRL
jgi:hypothetical protein